MVMLMLASGSHAQDNYETSAASPKVYAGKYVKVGIEKLEINFTNEERVFDIYAVNSGDRKVKVLVKVESHEASCDDINFKIGGEKSISSYPVIVKAKEEVSMSITESHAYVCDLVKMVGHKVEYN